METRRELIGAATLFVGAGCLGDGNGNRNGNGDGRAGPSVSSPAFDAGATIPTKYTCDGEDVSPPLRIRGTQDAVESLALVVDDPDAPSETSFVHWLLWNVPPDTEEIPEDIPQEQTVAALDGAAQGTNDFGEIGYRGPCPPADDGPHTYRFTVLALDTMLDLDPGADRETFQSEADPHVRGETTISADYERQ
ncbi:YbhB/YbcL family Raf kinase inhibitor-like protein [Natronomonas sp.]|uniref:YbhB/YbcL family Raf kinase inhibitor-like protein n=1 Tax=Natronomonas sp. TaxID=2184060 RepID=UPI002FC3B56F